MDKNNRIPLYLQLMDTIINKIKNKEYKENEQLPSERELCLIYDLSRITVRQTLQELEREGYIYKLRGKGTFVAPKTYSQNLVKLYSFTEEMRKLGKEPRTKVLSFQLIQVEEQLASKLDIDSTEEVYQIVRLRLADEEPLMYETSFLPKKFFKGLVKEELSEKPMYEVFYEKYNISVTRAVERFAASIIRNEEAAYLNTTNEAPCMLIKRSAYHEDNLIEYTISVARGDKFDYTVELT